jgi:predicted DsbA family dithiol-disulfide isomerase
VKVEIYSDIACPWCFIGKHRFERALQAFPRAADVEVVYRPYQLDPDQSDSAQPLLDALAAHWGAAQAERMAAQIGEIGRAEGIDFRIDRALAVNTFECHRLLWHAGREYRRPTQGALVGRLFAAYFSEGRNVRDHRTLTELAAEVGMERDRTAAFLDSEEDGRDVRAAMTAARSGGVTAVPSYVIGGARRVSGAQEPSRFLELLEAAAG